MELRRQWSRSNQRHGIRPRGDPFISGCRARGGILSGHFTSVVLLHIMPQIIQTDFTMGPELRENENIISRVVFTLTRNLSRCFPDVREEIVCAFDDVLRLEGEGEYETCILDSLFPMHVQNGRPFLRYRPREISSLESAIVFLLVCHFVSRSILS